jgi:hypothetical protein
MPSKILVATAAALFVLTIVAYNVGSVRTDTDYSTLTMVP